MSFGQRLLEARKKKNVSQDELAKQLGTKGPAIGRYERDEMKPSIDSAARMADLLDVSLDYLVGKTDQELDSKTLNRVLEVQQLPDEDRKQVFMVVDALVRDFKAKKAYAH